MKNFIYPFILILSFFIFSCVDEKDKTFSTVLNNSQNTTVSIYQQQIFIIFKKEYEILRIKQENNQWIIEERSSIANTNLLPIGKFHLFQNSNQSTAFIDFPNDLYRRKAVISSLDTSFYFQLSTDFDSEQGWEVEKMTSPNRFLKNKFTANTVLILPNDPRQEGILSSCFYCPHWYAEIYAQLYLELAQLQPIFNQ